MGKKVVVQIGRLDRNYRKRISFSFEGKNGDAELSSHFVLNTGDILDGESLLIFPKSIVFQDDLINNESLKGKDTFLKTINDQDINEYLTNPYPLLEKHPHVTSNTNLLVVDSIGNYYFRGENFSFDNSLNTITLQIYSFLISNFSDDAFTEIYIDISSGHNIYISAMLNALYRFVPFVKFRRYLSVENNRLLAFILNSDPIIPGSAHVIKIQKSEFKAKAFNSLTYKDSSAASQIIKLLFKDKSYYNEICEFINKQYFLLHGAFVYGIPMMLTLCDYILLNKIFEGVGLNQILDDLAGFMTSGNTEVATIDESLFYSMTYAVSIGDYIFKRFKEIIEHKEIEFIINGKEDTLENALLKTSGQILQNSYGQPISNYLNEIRMIYTQFKKIENNTGQYLSGAEIIHQNNPSYEIRDTFDSRNYFAHLGCELNAFQMKSIEGKLMVSYNGLINLQSILRYIKK